MNEGERAHQRAGTLAQLKVSFHEEAQEEDRRLASSFKQEQRVADGVRRANRHWLLALDHSLEMTTGIGLSRFAPPEAAQAVGC